PFLLLALPPVASVFSAILGLLVLIGWAFGIEELKRVTPGFAAMNPATAVLFILIGISFGLTLGSRQSRLARIVGNVLASVVLLTALAELIELTGFWHSPLDEFLFAGKLWDPQEKVLNRMAPNTALNLLLTAIAILELDLSGRRLFGQALGIVVGFVSALSLTGYAYEERAFIGLAQSVPMAVHSAVAFLLLAGGI